MAGAKPSGSLVPAIAWLDACDVGRGVGAAAVVAEEEEAKIHDRSTPGWINEPGGKFSSSGRETWGRCAHEASRSGQESIDRANFFLRFFSSLDFEPGGESSERGSLPSKGDDDDDGLRTRLSSVRAREGSWLIVLRARVYVRRSTSWSVQQEACCPGLD